jgi:pimeloyl-ACP methyl ester carboxylesterase
MSEVELSAGTVEYEDTGGSAPVVVLVHGLAMNGSLWRHVVADLRADYRCVVPTWPLGGHRRPMRPDADLSMTGQARLLAEFLDRLGLSDVTLVANDWAGPLVLVAEGATGRVGRLVIGSCEAFENYPPGLPGRAVWLAAHVPGGVNALAQPLRWRRLRRLPFAFGRMSKRPIPDEVMDDWLAPLLTQRAIRRDVIRYVRATPTDTLERAAASFGAFDRPVLVVWAAEDRVMPPEHGRRLAAAFPHGRYVEVADSYTLLPEDQPRAFTAHLRAFLADTVTPAA